MTGSSPAQRRTKSRGYQEPEEEEKEGAAPSSKWRRCGGPLQRVHLYLSRSGPHSVAGQWHYDLDYDDGDREMKYESKIKLKSGPAAAAVLTRTCACAVAASNGGQKEEADREAAGPSPADRL